MVLCETAKDFGNQYTMRFLPDFLIPYGVIRSDKILEAVEENSDSANLDKVCSVLGCIDFRTAKKYIEYGRITIERASIALAQHLSSFTGKAFDFEFTPNTHFLSYFHSLVNGYNSLQVHIHGGNGYEVQRNPSHFVGLNWPLTKPMTYASDSVQPSDTS